MKTAKKKRTKSPTARAMEELRKLGCFAWVVESTIPKTFIKRDFMGWADIIYLTGVCDGVPSAGSGSIVGVQVTTNTGGHHANRKAKVLAEPRALAWLRSGGLIELWSYALQGARGEKKTWVLRKEELTIEDFEGRP